MVGPGVTKGIGKNSPDHERVADNSRPSPDEGRFLVGLNQDPRAFCNDLKLLCLLRVIGAFLRIFFNERLNAG